MIHTARKVNDAKPTWVIEKVKMAIADFLKENPDKQVHEIVMACAGLAFQPDIDDLRGSPALGIIKELSNLHNGKILGVEPNIDTLPDSVKNIELVNFEQAIKKANVHILLVDHKEFKNKNLNLKYLVDTKGLWKR